MKKYYDMEIFHLKEKWTIWEFNNDIKLNHQAAVWMCGHKQELESVKERISILQPKKAVESD
jgi:hypothetical protein